MTGVQVPRPTRGIIKFPACDRCTTSFPISLTTWNVFLSTLTVPMTCLTLASQPHADCWRENLSHCFSYRLSEWHIHCVHTQGAVTTNGATDRYPLPWPTRKVNTLRTILLSARMFSSCVLRPALNTMPVRRGAYWLCCPPQKWKWGNAWRRRTGHDAPPSRCAARQHPLGDHRLLGRWVVSGLNHPTQF